MVKKNYQPFSYTICASTYALLPYRDGHRSLTRILEDRGEFIVEESSYKTVTKSCIFYRGSLKSATLYAQKAVRVKHKPPIIIGEYYGNPLVFFPTHSPKNPDTVWLNYDAIDLIESDSTGRGSIVYFCNGQTIHLDVTAIALRNQHSFAGSLERHFKKTQEMFGQKINYTVKRKYLLEPEEPI